MAMNIISYLVKFESDQKIGLSFHSGGLPRVDTDGAFFPSRPESAETREFSVKEGDVLMVATDGVFDNLPDSTIVKEMVKVQGSTDLLLLQQAANSIAQQARKLAFDEDYMSPFARNARENGINAIGKDGILYTHVHLYAHARKRIRANKLEHMHTPNRRLTNERTHSFTHSNLGVCVETYEWGVWGGRRGYVHVYNLFTFDKLM